MVLLTRALGKEKQKENNLGVGSAEIGFALCNFMAFLNDKCGHGVGAEYMVDPQNN